MGTLGDPRNCGERGKCRTMKLWGLWELWEMQSPGNHGIMATVGIVGNLRLQEHGDCENYGDCGDHGKQVCGT